MFEKEAEEYTDKYDIMNADLSPKSPRHIVLDVFKAGAAFGYNKANEWHYPSKGEYPKDEKYVLIYTDLKNAYVARKPKGDKYFFITMGGGFVQISAVIAWKEIVLPKEMKEK